MIGDIYKCEKCGIVVSVIEDCTKEKCGVVCCDSMMKKLEEHTSALEGKEKHVPVIEISGNSVKVKVGSVPHPMEKEHWINMVRLVQGGDIVAEKMLNPGDKPEAEFCLDNTDNLKAKAYCNVHGYWTN